MSMLPSFPDVFGRGQFDINATGLALLGQTRMLTAATSSDILTIEPRNFILIIAIVPSLSATGQPGMRFGASPGVVDSTTSYWSRNMRATNNAAAVPGNFGNDVRPDATGLILGYSRTDAVQTDISDVGGTEHRMVFISIWDLPGYRSTCQWVMTKGTGAAATIGHMWTGWGEWDDTNPIQAIQLNAFDGVATLGAFSGFSVWGSTLP